MLKKYLYSIAVFSVVLSALGGFAWVNELHAASSEPKPIAAPNLVVSWNTEPVPFEDLRFE